MVVLVASILGIVALAFVLYPLYRRTAEAADVVQEQTTSEVGEATPTEREQAARAALQEVELDYQLGNIADGDYTQLRERYIRRALVALKSRYTREQELDNEIEEQLRTMKEQERNASEG